MENDYGLKTKEIEQIVFLIGLRLCDYTKSEIITTMQKYKVDTTEFDELVKIVSDIITDYDLSVIDLYNELTEMDDYAFLKKQAKILKVKNVLKLDELELRAAISKVLLEQKVIMNLPKARDLEFVIFDVETTSPDDGYRIIEIGAIKAAFRNNELVILDRYQRFIQVGVSVETMYIFNGTYKESISQLTGITDIMLRTKGIDATTGLKEFYDFIGDAILVAHNHSFDMGKLGKQFAIKNTTEGELFLRASICTCAMARLCFPKGHELDPKKNIRVDGHKLKEVSSYCGFSMSEDKAHRADYDAEFTFYILKTMFKMLDINEDTPANELIIKGLGNKMPKIPKKEQEMVDKVVAYYARQKKKAYVDFEHLNLLTTTNIKFSTYFIEQMENGNDQKARRRR